ncbi:TonB-dependent receptor [Psychromonas antarctica]|uniref:TonB-dependent receptor n=1 Tax=Psychromonas antarctica TaxID=67573 RepID=UPI0030841987
MLGNKSERNSFTGWEHQPMARLLWTPHSRHSFWGAISQGARIPSLIENNVIALGTSPFSIPTKIVGSADVDSEKSLSKELGYRYSANSWNMALSLFHTKAIDAIAIAPNFANSVISFNFVSNAELITYGGEAVIKWQLFEQLTTELGYSFTSYKYDLVSGTKAVIGYDSYLRQIISKINYSITADHSIFALYRIEDGDAYGTDSYSVLDLTWNWLISPVVALSLSGNNLLYSKHLEYNNTSETYTVATYIEPSYLAKITLKF